MDFSGILPFFLTAAAIGFIYVRRSRAKTRKYGPREVSHTASSSVFVERDMASVRTEITEKLETQGLSVHSEDDSRTVYEDSTIGFFHWGFLYIIDFEERNGGTQLDIGIFGKGPNPPRKKTQEAFLGEFISGRIMPL